MSSDSTRGARDLRGRYSWFVARRFLRARHQGFLSLISFLSALGFAVGTASLILALALMTGFQTDMIDKILGANAHLLVFPEGTDRIDEPDRVAAVLGALPGVEAAAPVVFGHAVILASGRLKSYATVMGLAPVDAIEVMEIEEAMRDGASFLDLASETSSGRPGIILGEELALRLGALEGDQLTIIVPRLRLAPWGASVERASFELVGTFATDYSDYDAGWAFIDLEQARRVYGLPDAASYVASRIEDLGDLEELEIEAAAQLGDGYRVTDIIRYNRSLFSALKLEKLLMFFAVGLIVIVAALSVVSTLVLTVTQKVRVIGVLAAMGASPRGIMRIFVLQGATMGAIGTLVGAALGVLVALVLDHFKLISLDGTVYLLDYLPFLVLPGDLLAIVLAAVVVAFLATLYPAWRAARLDPVEALRGE